MRNVALMLLALWGIWSPANAQSTPQAAAIPVGVVTAERKPVTKSQDFVGRVEAVQRVEVRARITGYLEKVEFKEGDLIKEGAPLYRIEKGLFQAAVEQAQGALERSKAAKALTEIQLQRAEELLSNRSPARQVARDQALAADQSGRRRDPDRRSQSADRQDQSRLHRHHLADRGQDRPDQHHQGQCRRPATAARSRSSSARTRCM